VFSSLPLRVHKVYIRVSFSDTFLRWLFFNNSVSIVKLIVDCINVANIFNEDKRVMHRFEELSRNLCYALRVKRLQIMDNQNVNPRMTNVNPFWNSKPELFFDITCLRIPYQPCIVVFVNFFFRYIRLEPA
jgi:hypothetical protein